MEVYTCAVCGTSYNEREVLKAKCDECGKVICVYCTSIEGGKDVCDRCVDEMMFNEKKQN